MPDLDKFQKPNGELKVVVSDTVDMNVFQEKYEIINFENGVYTVKSKGNVPDNFNNDENIQEENTTEINGQIYKITPIE